MQKRVRRAVVVFTLVGIASIAYGVTILVQYFESTRLGETGERIAGAIFVIAGLVLVGSAVWMAHYARRMDAED